VASKDAAKKKAARPRKPPAPPACRVVLGDCVEVMASLPDESIDAIVCDPPYGLEFMGKDWDSFRIDKRAARWSGDERTGGAGAGFGEIPGGSRPPSFGKRRTTGLCRTCGKRDAFRNPHACGDQADWVTIPVDDSPMEMRAFQNWVALWAVEAYRVLKPGGHLLAFGGTRTYHRLACGVEEAGFDIRDSLHWIYGSGFPKSLDVGKSIDAKLGAVREPVGQGENFGRSRIEDGKVAYGDYAGTWDITKPSSDEAVTWDGWGTALKPAHEPIVLARKPLAGTVVETVLAHGTGALNVQAARVGDIGGQKSGPRPKVNPGATSFAPHAEYSIPLDAGRWPANVVLSHLDECKGSGPNHTDVLCAPGCPVAELNEASGETVSRSGGSSGTTFSAGVPGMARDDPRGGHDDAGGAARFFYIAKPRRRERVGGTVRNLHPTVKPIDLMRWLVRLVTPPGGVVLDPFLGSGSTGCAAMVEGFRFLGIERDEGSHQTALERISDYAFAHDRDRPVAA
jgi:DNA modification methylase